MFPGKEQCAHSFRRENVALLGTQQGVQYGWIINYSEVVKRDRMEIYNLDPYQCLIHE